MSVCVFLCLPACVIETDIKKNKQTVKHTYEDRTKESQAEIYRNLSECLSGFICLCVYLSFGSSVCLSFCLLCLCWLICAFCLHACLPVCLSVCLSSCLSVSHSSAFDIRLIWSLDSAKPAPHAESADNITLETRILCT